MSIFIAVIIVVGLVAAVLCSTRCIMRSDKRNKLPKEIADELDPYNNSAG